MNDPKARPLYSRRDLSDLKTYDRARILEILGSFDDREMPDDAFALRAADLLDPARVPGLEDAAKAGNASAVLDAVYQACKAEAAEAERPAVTPEQIQQAEDVLAHRFSFYGEEHQLPEDIDWDFNPGTRHWSMDLNRFSYLGTLLRAYRGAGDARFGRKALDLILDWIAKCDFGRAFGGTPYMFGSYLNNAIHCSAWARTIRELLPDGLVAPVELLRVLKSLQEQLAYLEVVTNGHAGNWPTIGCQGILATLATLPVLRDTDRFADYCTRTMAEQVDEQILPDGVQDELTPHYHAVVVNNVLNATRSLRELGRELPPQTHATFRKMVHYLQQTIMPDESAQLAFNDSDAAAVPHIDDRLIELGLKDCLTPKDRLDPELFPYAGVAFMRQKQTDGDLYLAFDGGPYGRGHQHEDKLGFWLFAYGRNLIVDPGRHLYDSSEASYRPYLIGTRAHSTMMVDGQPQHSRGRPDTWIAKEPVPLAWQVSDGEIRASAAYDLGYGEDNAIAVVHRREIVFVGERFWVVFDRVEGSGTHALESRFQFAPCALDLSGARARTCFDDANLLLWALSSPDYSDIHIEEGQENPRSGWYSASYNRIQTAPALSLSATADLPFTAATLLFPYRGKEAPHATFVLDGDVVTVTTEETGEVRVASSLA